MNFKKLVFLGLFIVNYSLAVDLNKLNQETFGLYDALVNADVPKVKEILASKGNDISRDNYFMVIGTAARALIEEMGTAQRAQGPTRTEMRTVRRAQVRTRERGEMGIPESVETSEREKFNKQRAANELIRDKMVERGFLEQQSARRDV